MNGMQRINSSDLDLATIEHVKHTGENQQPRLISQHQQMMDSQEMTLEQLQTEQMQAQAQRQRQMQMQWQQQLSGVRQIQSNYQLQQRAKFTGTYDSNKSGQQLVLKRNEYNSDSNSNSNSHEMDEHSSRTAIDHATSINSVVKPENMIMVDGRSRDAQQVFYDGVNDVRNLQHKSMHQRQFSSNVPSQYHSAQGSTEQRPSVVPSQVPSTHMKRGFSNNNGNHQQSMTAMKRSPREGNDVAQESGIAGMFYSKRAGAGINKYNIPGVKSHGSSVDKKLANQLSSGQRTTETRLNAGRSVNAKNKGSIPKASYLTSMHTQ